MRRMSDSLRLHIDLAASAETLYGAWLSPTGHSEMTGGGASVEPFVGGRHSAWDGYISGETLELDQNRRIVQSWRTTDFAHDADDSRVELRFEPIDGGTRISLAHTNIPAGDGPRYDRGWREFYFDKMLARFGAVGPASSARDGAARERAARDSAARKRAQASAKPKPAPRKATQPKAKAVKAKPPKAKAKKKAAPARPKKKATKAKRRGAATVAKGKKGGKGGAKRRKSTPKKRSKKAAKKK